MNTGTSTVRSLPGGAAYREVIPELSRERAVELVALIRRIALRLARRLPSHVSLDDLIGAGHVGLMEAMQRFEPSVCDRFEAFAEYRIKGAMLDAIRSSDPLSRDARRHARRLVRVIADLHASLRREPQEEEIAAAMEMTVDAYRTLLGELSARGVVSLDERDDPERGVSALRASAATDPADGAARRELVEHLAGAIAELPERLQTFLSLYYFEDCTLKEIGRIMGFSESRACQLHSEAVLRLRARMKSDDGAGPLVG